jgi:hypothetical protein
MTGQRRLATLAVVALLAILGCTAGCTADAPSPHPPSPAAGTTVPPETTVPAESTGPPPPTGPPPQPTVRAAVELSPADPGATARFAVVTPDGGAHIVLQPPDGAGPLSLTTVDPSGAPVGSVALPPMAQVFGAHRLADGEVLVTGQFPRPGRDYGFVAVDPVSGATRTVVAVPYEDGTAFSFGRSALSADGSELFLFVATTIALRHLDLLVAVDPRTGAFIGGRDLFEEVRQVSSAPVATHAGGLLPRRDGGVTLVFDVWPRGAGVVPDPGLLDYDADLQPVGTPTRVRVGGTPSDVQSAAVAPDGAVHLLVQPRSGDRIVTVRDGVVDPVADLGGHSYDDTMAIDTAAEWAVLPSAGGVRAVDLRTGAVGQVDFGCPQVEPVETALSGAGPTRAVLLGRCAGSPVLWLLGGPAP